MNKSIEKQTAHQRRIPKELESKIDRIEIRAVNEAGYDEFGFNRESLKSMVPLGLFFYEKWFRVEIDGIDNIPKEGPAIIVPNHSGQLPFDGMMISVAAMKEMEPPRMPRSMIEKWFPTLPIFGRILTRGGQVVGITENAEKLLANGELVMIFPEGALGSGKIWSNRYQIQRFTHGFMELAIRYKAPIVPTAVIGGEEQAPAFVNVEWLAKKIGFPYFPLTPTFPWLGLLGFVPLPSKYRIYFGKPLEFAGFEADIDHPERIHEHVEIVRATVQEMVNEGLRKRPFPGL
jgi:1-acyl-sn-glycerol-3-phosphate acyltransferase